MIFLEESKNIISQMDRSIKVTQLASQGKIGHLSIAFVDSAVGGMMVNVVKCFRERFPNVQLTLLEMTSAQQLKALYDGEIHVGFLRTVDPSQHIASRLYTNESLVAVLPDIHPLANQPSLSLRSLANEPFIFPPHPMGAAFHDLIMDCCRQYGFKPHIVQEAVQMYTIVNLVAAGIGISIVPSSVSVFQRNDVVFRSFIEETPPVPLYAAWKTDTSNDTVLANFLEVVEVTSNSQTS
ncbi:Hca operon transcriptional activator [compost metagenome]